MRTMTLDEKINIKAKLAAKGVVLHQVLCALDTAAAISLYWRCFGRPVSTHSSPKKWRH